MKARNASTRSYPIFLAIDVLVNLIAVSQMDPYDSGRSVLRTGLGARLGSAALAQVVFFVASHTIFLSSFFRFDVLVY
jgi:hypothetical protein